MGRQEIFIFHGRRSCCHDCGRRVDSGTVAILNRDFRRRFRRCNWNYMHCSMVVGWETAVQSPARIGFHDAEREQTECCSNKERME